MSNGDPRTNQEVEKSEQVQTRPASDIPAESSSKSATPSHSETPSTSAKEANSATKTPAKPIVKPAATAAVPEKPKKAPPPPNPRVEAAKLQAEQLRAVLVQAFGEGVVEETGAAHVTPMLIIANPRWLDVVEYLRTHEDWQLNYVECMAGTDYPDYLEIVLYIQSITKPHFVCLKTRTSRENATVPSLVSSHPGVNWEEREIYDLLGVQFTGHPDMRRIMMWEGFKGHPLRKDYDEWTEGGTSDGSD